MIHFPRGSYCWRLAVTAAAAAAAGAILLTACGGPAGASAGATISPVSGARPAGFAGNTGTPSVLSTARPSTSVSMSGMPTSAPPAAAVRPVSANAVTILNFAFGPQVVMVKAGTTVHWTNHDAEAHTVTSNTGAFTSPVLQPGAGYSFTFTKPGTYHYHCSIHPFMTGMVMVS
jgi:plastocyanin